MPREESESHRRSAAALVPLRMLALLLVGTVIAPKSAMAKVFDVAAGNVYGPGGLVAALNEANANSENDRINLQPGSTYLLTQLHDDSDTVNGLPSITGTIIISNGLRARTTPAIIERSAEAPPFRVLHVSPTGALGLINVVLRGGGGISVTPGGGLFNSGRSTVLINSVVRNNSASSGGGIFNSGEGVMRIYGSSIRANVAKQGGGGIYNMGALTLTDSTISFNTSDAFGGGGLTNYGGRVTLKSSTVSRNRAGGGGGSGGGGIYNWLGSMTLTNATISSNAEDTLGGGIKNQGTAVFSNVTISKNDAGLFGGGIHNIGTLSLANTLIAGNTILGKERAAAGTVDCVGILTSRGYNLVGDSQGCDFRAATGDLIGALPRLGLLLDNGGLTQTHSLSVGVPLVSAALDAGNPAPPGSGGNSCEATDQRGFPRPVSGPGFAGRFRCDIGAFEFGMRLVNEYLSEPTRLSPTTAPGDVSGCPAGYFGKSRFSWRYKNIGAALLTDLLVEVRVLGNRNLLWNADGPIAEGVKARLTVPPEGDFSDGLLFSEESVDVPFVICLRDNRSFAFDVNVLGIVP